MASVRLFVFYLTLGLIQVCEIDISDIMQGGGYDLSISLVVQNMVAQVWQPGHV